MKFKVGDHVKILTTGDTGVIGKVDVENDVPYLVYFIYNGTIRNAWYLENSLKLINLLRYDFDENKEIKQ